MLRTPSTSAVYELVRSGTTRTGDLISRTGLSEAGVRKALAALSGAHLVHRAAHGTWTLTAPASNLTSRAT